MKSVLLLSLLIPFVSATAADLAINGRNGSDADFALIGPDARQQVIISAGELDVTHEASFSVQPAGIVEMLQPGYFKPIGDGKATITAQVSGHNPVSIGVNVEKCQTPLPINFGNEVVPILTKYGCNSGGCHGKSGGQNGFRLSLLGYEPWNDYDYLINEGRGRRIFPAAPEHSLLLTKATGEIPHGGGARLDIDSHDYEFLARWIRMGMPYGSEEDPTIERIEVFPRERTATAGAKQQLVVTAFYSDGTTRDVTRAVQYEANQKEMAEVDEDGLVSLNELPGSTSIMVRFQEHVGVFIANIPLGAPVELPKPNNFVDHYIFRKLELLGLPPSDLADDSTFLRRVTIDIAGRLPTQEEVEAFLAETSANKREAKIDALLDSPEYAEWFANKWSAVLRNKRTATEYARGTFAFHDWIRASLHANKPFDQFVGELVTASGEIGQNPPVAWYRAVKDQKEQMQDVAQVFLGIRMQCAQCHHHPYEKWSQDDYYGMTAFFSTLQRKPGEQPSEEIVFHRRRTASSQNPNTRETLKPTPLGAEAIEIPEEQDPRHSLAGWMRDPENPFFARMLVNRYWKHFFGRGIVEPEDDMRVTNPATHPQLIEDLAEYFVASGYDLKDLIRVICNSRTYQLSADPNGYNTDDRQNYSRYYPRRLPAEILLDAINAVAKTNESFRNQEVGTRAVALPDDQYNKDVYFLSVFGRPEMDSACECERTLDANLAQSLHLINSTTIQSKLTASTGRAATLAADAEKNDEAKIGELYFNAFARAPRPDELKTAIAHLEKKRGQAATDEKLSDAQAVREGFEDILWALVNTKEFLFNH